MEMILSSDVSTNATEVCMHGCGDCNGYDPDIHLCNPYCALDGLPCIIRFCIDCIVDCFCPINL